MLCRRIRWSEYPFCLRAAAWGLWIRCSQSVVVEYGGSGLLGLVFMAYPPPEPGPSASRVVLTPMRGSRW